VRYLRLTLFRLRGMIACQYQCHVIVRDRRLRVLPLVLNVDAELLNTLGDLGKLIWPGAQ
jgi:hypothetical protein